jgi:hypothetical protein
MTWVFYFPTEETARAAGRELEAEDYLVGVELARSGGDCWDGKRLWWLPWLLLAAKPYEFDDPDQAFHRNRFEALAKRWRGFYDGWETGWVERDWVEEALGVDLGGAS